ncbi:DUF697 domain-containing protein [Acidaminobacter sp. JC074]|uniref:DUF697 domain-containing protein n=1 Tax=Acidaminobacter sp. JC074 TaxID=2530199 RepID=UPI001F109F49|nr:DUF697 domain-containing protein [Acidaminobacter sp. JC074]MCH4889750.1 DUF697 domain-containing protein [Acidaminobacter sp. JC074]
MKQLKIILFFVILYFGYFFVNSMFKVIDFLSFDQVYLSYVLYGLFATLVLVYFIYPMMKYLSRPSFNQLKSFIEEDKHQKKFLNYFNKRDNVGLSDKEELKAHLIHKVDEFDGIIKQFAQQTTVTVMVSPNSFIDGLSIFLSNSQMIYKLSSILGLRYNFKSLMRMYFSVLSVASVTGLVEEFDETIEAIIEELAEEFSELIAEESGKSVGSKVPFFNIAVNALSPVLQAAGNYAFMYYSGLKFKYELLNIVEDQNLSEKEVKKRARRRARSLKYAYVKEMSGKVLTGTGRKITKLNPFKKK